MLIAPKRVLTVAAADTLPSGCGRRVAHAAWTNMQVDARLVHRRLGTIGCSNNVDAGIYLLVWHYADVVS